MLMYVTEATGNNSIKNLKQKKMKRIIYTMLIGMLGSTLTLAQVGVNNQNPQTTLDIQGQNPNAATTATDGILIPRVNALPTTGNEIGQLLYLADGTTSQGFYYWEGTTWTSFSKAISNPGSGWTLNGNAALGTTGITIPNATALSPATTSYIGTTGAENLILGTNGINQIMIDEDTQDFWGGASATEAANLSWGANNNLTGAFHMKLLGGNNTAQNAKSGAVLGTHNTMDNSEEGIVIGQNNTSEGKDNIAVGLHNTVKNGTLVMGQHNIGDNESIVAGFDNTASQEAIIVGEYLDSNAKKNTTLIGTGMHPSGTAYPIKAQQDYETLFAANKIDFSGNQKIGIGLDSSSNSENLESLEAIKVPANNTASIATCTPGQLVFDTNTNKLKGCINIATVPTWKVLH